MSRQEDFDREPFGEENGLREAKGARPRIAVFVAAVLLGALGLWFFAGRDRELPPPPPSPAGEERASVPEAPFLSDSLPVPEEGPPEVIPEMPDVPPVLPTLDGSDDLARRLIMELMPGRVPDRWLQSEDLVRLFVVIVDNVAEGLSPRRHLAFMAPKGKLEAIGTERGPILDPRSYERYDPVGEAFAALDPGVTARVYRALGGLFQEAYLDLGYDERPFDRTFEKALHRLLSVPVVEGEVPLQRGDKSVHFADPDLEDLSQAEKHLLRMGPKNMRKVQQALGGMAAALGMSPG
jgi:hypothetical protein